MEIWLIWIIIGLIFTALELILSGGIIIFLGIAALLVGAGIYLGYITSFVVAMTSFFMISLFLMIVLRSFFIKYFEGDSRVENTDENLDNYGSIVTVIEDILPHIEGRVSYRDSSWSARSDEEIKAGDKAINSCGGDRAVKVQLIEQYISELGNVLGKGKVTVLPEGMANIKGFFEVLRSY